MATRNQFTHKILFENKRFANFREVFASFRAVFAQFFHQNFAKTRFKRFPIEKKNWHQKNFFWKFSRNFFGEKNRFFYIFSHVFWGATQKRASPAASLTFFAPDKLIWSSVRPLELILAWGTVLGWPPRAPLAGTWAPRWQLSRGGVWAIFLIILNGKE